MFWGTDSLMGGGGVSVWMIFISFGSVVSWLVFCV